MCISYKLRFVSTPDLSKDIQKRASELKKARHNLSSLNRELSQDFSRLKKINIALTRFSPKKVNLKEEHPRVKDPFAEKRQRLRQLSAEIMYDVIRIIREIHTMLADVKRLSLDADTILYRESKTLDRLHKEVIKLDNYDAVRVLNAKLNRIKEDLKMACRRVYESAKSPEFIEPFAKRKEKPVSKSLASFGVEAAELESLLEKLSLENIDEITKDAEKELDGLRKLELAAVSVMPELGSYINHIGKNLRFLEPPVARRLEERLDKAEMSIKKAEKLISCWAGKLFTEIVIFEKIKK